MSSGDDVQKVDYSGVQSGFQNLAGTFGKYMGEAYDWAKGQWQKQEPYSDEVQQIMLDQAHAGADWAQADRQRWEETYKPVEDAYVQQAINYDTPGRREAEAGRYAAQASAAAEQAGDEAKRQLTTFGVKPTDVRMGALDTGVRMTKAANAVGASESARRNVENTGLALKQGVIQQGNQYPGRAIANANMGQAAGTAGANIGIATDTAYGNLMGTAPQWGGLNVSALQGWNTSLTDQQKANIAVNEANQSSGGVGKLAGTLIGGAAGAYFGGPMGASVGANIGGQAGAQFAEGGPVDITKNGGHVPYEMSPSGGARTDDINAVIPGVGGGPPQEAQIDAGEFIFPERTTMYYGTKYLQGLIDKADKAMAQQGQPQQEGPPQGPQPGPPPPGVIPMPGYADGGGVEITRGASTELDPDTFAPKERGWRDYGRDAVKGMSAMGGAAAAPAQKSALDIYTRWGAANGGVVPTSDYDERDWFPGIEDAYPNSTADPLGRAVNRGEAATRSQDFEYGMAFDMGPKGTPGRAEEQSRRQGKSVDEDYEERAQADRHRALLKSRGYAEGGFVGTQMADKGEIRGDYESIGIEGRPPGDPNYINPRHYDEIQRDMQEWNRSGKRGPPPSFSTFPRDFENQRPPYKMERWRPQRPTSGRERGTQVAQSYQQGGVVDTRPFDYRREHNEGEDLGVPIGRGRLSGRGSYERDVLEGEVGYDYPVNNRTTLGVRGNASKYIGPHGDMERPELGVRVRGSVKFKDGGAVQMADKGDIRTRRQLMGMSPDADYRDDLDEEFESKGYKDDSLGADQLVTPEDREHWDIMTGKQGKPTEYWRRRERPMSGSPVIRASYQQGGVIPQPAYEAPFDPQRFQDEQDQVRVDAHLAEVTKPHYPSVMDTANARNVDAFYGDPYSGVYEGRQGSRMEMLPMSDVIGKTPRKVLAMTGLDVQVPPVIADHMSRGRLAANKSALVGLGYDPARTMLTPAATGGFGGTYDKDKDRMWADVSRDGPSNVVHEAVHRAVEKLRGGAAKDIGHDEEEMLVRAVMQKFYGNVELPAGQPPLKHPKDEPERWRRQQAEAKHALENDPKFRMKLDALERAAAQMIYEKRPYGGPR